MFAGFHFEILQKYRIFSNKCPGAHLMSKLYIPWDRGQIGMKLKTKHVIYQKLATFCKIRISMWTGLQVLFLSCKSVFYRPEHNAKGGPHETDFWVPWNVEMKYMNW